LVYSLDYFKPRISSNVACNSIQCVDIDNCNENAPFVVIGASGVTESNAIRRAVWMNESPHQGLFSKELEEAEREEEERGEGILLYLFLVTVSVLTCFQARRLRRLRNI